MCAVPSGLKLLSAPPSVQAALQEEREARPQAWKRPDGLWQRRAHMGKRVLMFMAG